MPAIRVKNLTKKFGDFVAIDNVSFDIEKNHVVGFLGPNGAGKTTTLRMLVGLSRPTSGDISIAETPVIFGKMTAGRKIGYLPEMPSMYGWMSGYEYLRFISDIFGMTRSESEAKIAELLKLVDLTDAKGKKIAAYSGGMKQRLGIAQALLNDPEVIIMDEPVSALDPIGRKEVLDVIAKLKSHRTVLFSTHILSDVDKICDDVVIISAGKLVAASPLAELKAKYASPILEVEFFSGAEAVAAKVAQEKWAKKVEQNGNLLRIWPSDDSVVEQNIPLKYFAKQSLGVLRYGLSLPEAEDLFLDLTGGEK